MPTEAKVILDSVSPAGHRVTTMEVNLHRFVLAELNTHRMFSRNSASSRAIPVARQLERVRDDPAIPVVWPSEQRGMQGGEPLSEDYAQVARSQWLIASRAAMKNAERMVEIGVHKSIVNRLLEPFMWHTVIITSTDWDNFWRQRCSPLAQPEIRVAAELMHEAYEASEPDRIVAHDWHAPYITADDDDLSLPMQCKVSAARCARVSYLTHDGVRDPQEDIKMYDRLVSAEPAHASPLEHVCRARQPDEDQRGNLIGFAQLRHIELGF